MLISLSLLAITYLQVFAQVSKWDGTTQQITKGSGTAKDPWQIENAAQWAWATQNSAYYGSRAVHLRLMVNLDLAPTTPGGNSPYFDRRNNDFRGFFDGNNKTISNFR